MRIRSKTASLVWKALIIVAELIGLAVSFGLFKGQFNVSSLVYFTILSNIVVMVYCFVALVVLGARQGGSPTFCPVLKQIITIGITTTFLIAHFFLSSTLFKDGSLQIDMFMLHYVAPIMFILDWLLFDEKGRMPVWGPFAWTVLPLVYLAGVEVAVNGFGASLAVVDGSSGRYPYPFLDADALGWPYVIGLICALVAAFIVLGYVWRAIDGLLARSGRK